MYIESGGMMLAASFLIMTAIYCTLNTVMPGWVAFPLALASTVAFVAGVDV